MGSTGLYSPEFEHDSCGIGFVANIKSNKSHQIVSDALTILENMEHRGACGCENNTGDGAGIMIQTPHEFFFDECVKLGIHLPSYGKYGVGMLFFPRISVCKEECRDIFNRSAEKLGLEDTRLSQSARKSGWYRSYCPCPLNRKWNRFLLPAPIISAIPMSLKENYLCCATMPAIPLPIR